MMTSEETLAFIQAASWKGSRPGLERIRELLRRLGDPQNGLKYIHVAGTNGKGSTCMMLSSVLTAAGYRTGLYISPHLQSYNERMQINCRHASDPDMAAAAEAVKAAADEMEDIPTEFERVTAMAFWHFARQKCDIVVLEVGRGGTTDATNVIPSPELAVIANLGLEHTDVLGSTIEEIAAHKAGIIKPGCDVVLYQQREQGAADVVRRVCEEMGCLLTVTDETQLVSLQSDLYGQRLRYRNRPEVALRLIGTYQCKNAALALDSLDRLKARGWQIPESAVLEGMAAAIWPARFELLRREPPVLLDGAHNPNGVAELADCMAAYLPGQKAIFVMGVMADKDFDEMLAMLAPYMTEFIAVQADYYRALPSAEFADTARRVLPVPVTDGGSVPNGVALALRRAGANTPVCICGSLYTAGEVRDYFKL